MDNSCQLSVDSCQKKTDVRFAVETFSAVRQEGTPLAAAHWDETEAPLYGDRIGMPLSPGFYEAMELMDALHVVTARDKGALC
ncbi:MAG: hypothetical protein IJU37_00755 [Desulfovibrio sp.]|nr:hypothetical protein [Desulfovibrio sp.]